MRKAVDETGRVEPGMGESRGAERGEDGNRDRDRRRAPQ
jgi:hypothetical protein